MVSLISLPSRLDKRQLANALLILSDQLCGNKEGNLTGKQIEFARTIHSSGQDPLRLINDILDLAKIESGTVSVEVREVRLTDLRDYVERTFRPIAEHKRLDVARAHGYKSAVAVRGADALQLARKINFSAITLDIMMPDMDGYETMRRIRAIERFRELPILALTAKAMKGDREKCLEAGASDYIAKPVDTQHLLSLLRTWLHC